jgi:tetratricopeptide (TPR) repeat protein
LTGGARAADSWKVAAAEINDAIDAFRRGDLDRAEALARAAVDDESSAEWLHLLGLVQCRRGDPAAGVRWLLRACDSEPENLAFRVIAARALVDAGRAREVLAMPEPPPIASAPAMAMWQARGEAADAAGDDMVSERAWRTIAGAAPADWRAWANLGDALARLGRWAEASSALANALRLNPAEQPLQKKYAGALGHAGLHEQSAEQFRRMIESGTADSQTRLTLARLYADLGRHDESVHQLEEAARAVGASAEDGLLRIALPHGSHASSIGDSEIAALRELALLLERTNRMDGLRNLIDDAQGFGVAPERLGYPMALLALRDGDAARARQLLLTEDAKRDPVRWHVLMARIEESLGNAGAAFAEAEAMHDAVANRLDWRRRAADYLEKIDRWARTVDDDWVRKLTPLDPGPRRAPAFLVGFPRSGTTLLDTFLRGHPNTCVVEEQNMLNAAEAVIGDFADLASRSPHELEQARRAYFAELDRHIGPGFEGIVIDKLPLNMLGLPIVYSLFPDARVIFAQRHPCDVVLSCFLQAFAQNDAMACFLDLADAGRLYDSAMRLFSSGRELLPLSFHTSVYEDLIADPEAALRPAVKFLGLGWRPELLDYRATAMARGTINTPSYAQVVRPLSKAPAGRWRRYREQLKPVLPALLPWAERLGYPS